MKPLKSPRRKGSLTASCRTRSLGSNCLLWFLSLLRHYKKRIAPYQLRSNTSNPLSPRWETITTILARMAMQSQSSNILLSQDIVASVVSIVPSVAKPFYFLTLPFLCALDDEPMTPFNLDPLLECMSAILMKTEDDFMLIQVLRAFTRFFQRNVIPPLSIRQDIYHKFKDLDVMDLDKDVRLDAFGFQATFVKCLGLDFIANPPFKDDQAVEFAARVIFELPQAEIDKDFVKPYLRKPDSTGEYIRSYCALLEATIQFYFQAETNRPFSAEEINKIYVVMKRRVEKLLAFLRELDGKTLYEISKSSDSVQMSLIDLEPLECLTTWIVKGNSHQRNEQFLFLIPMYTQVYRSGIAHNSVMARALGGVSTLLEYITEGPAEFLQYEDIWLDAFSSIEMLVIDHPMEKSTGDMIFEIFHLLTILVRKQGKRMIAESAVRKFPGEFYKLIDNENWPEANARVIHAGAVLVGEILLALAKEMRRRGANVLKNWDLLKKWKLKLKELHARTSGEDKKSELTSLISALHLV